MLTSPSIFAVTVPLGADSKVKDPSARHVWTRGSYRLSLIERPGGVPCIERNARRFHESGHWTVCLCHVDHSISLASNSFLDVGPDAQGQGEHGPDGEAGVLQQLAEGEF